MKIDNTFGFMYMASMILIAKERGYSPQSLALEADHNTWLAFCYEIHDIAILRWRRLPDVPFVPQWFTYRFRELCIQCGGD